MGILYKRYCGRLRLLRSTDVEENPGSGNSCRPCRVRQYPGPAWDFVRIVSYCQRWRCDYFVLIILLMWLFCSSKRHISEFMVSHFGRLMLLLMSEIDQFRWLPVYVGDDFSAKRQCSYECGCCELNLVRICSSSHYFYVFGVYRNSEKLFDCCWRL